MTVKDLSAYVVQAHKMCGKRAKSTILDMLEKSRISIPDVQVFFERPEQNMGPFNSLPLSMRNSFRESALFHLQEQYCLTSRILAWLSYGPMFIFGVTLVRFGKYLRNIYGWNRSRHVMCLTGKFISFSGKCLIRGMQYIAEAILHTLRFTRLYAMPPLFALWRFADVDADRLLYHYITGIPSDPRITPVFKTTSSHVEGCGLIGIDLLPSDGKLYFLESNWNPALRDIRLDLYPDGDPVCGHLLDYAAQRSFRKIIFHPYNFLMCFEERSERAWHKLAEERGIALEIIDDPLFSSPFPRKSHFFVDPVGYEDTLFVTGRYFKSNPLSRLVAQKGFLEEIIRENKDSSDAGNAVSVPKSVVSDADIPAVSDESLYPNLIVKDVCTDCAKGIRLFKTRELPPDVNTWPFKAYEYVRTDNVRCGENDTGDEHVRIFRSHLLITPLGPVYLGAHAVVSRTSIPKTLEYGEVEDISPYIANFSAGARYERVSKDEDNACRSTTLAIGRIVDGFLRTKMNIECT